MKFLLHLFPALGLAAGSVWQSQQVLGKGAQDSSFIQSSIFGRQLHSEALPPPVEPLLPSYYARDFDDDVEYSGVDTFMHLPFTNCFSSDANETFDVAIVGAPFDLGSSSSSHSSTQPHQK